MRFTASFTNHPEEIMGLHEQNYQIFRGRLLETLSWVDDRSGA